MAPRFPILYCLEAAQCDTTSSCGIRSSCDNSKIQVGVRFKQGYIGQGQTLKLLRSGALTCINVVLLECLGPQRLANLAHSKRLKRLGSHCDFDRSHRTADIQLLAILELPSLLPLPSLPNKAPLCADVRRALTFERTGSRQELINQQPTTHSELPMNCKNEEQGN